ncbi:hypothetical protein ACJIZ3_007330 [Penstemon smallii]|uniref:Uncharacterized protein n=1 Tax=Penstemon smallii TaxID=265156 RepID=A0ABD3SAK5_9LAMI
MDFKGIKWAGNIYQKFETMCLEVEEVMVEDTVKYVENKVQKVGVSVKKFYSEVMQDLLPPSYIDPVKVAAGDLPLNPYAHTHTDIIKKPKQSIFDSQKEDKKTETQDENVNHLSPRSSRVFVENSNSELCSAKSKKLGIQRRPIGIKRISNNKKISSPVNSVSGDTSTKLVCDEFVRQNKDGSECTLSAADKIIPIESLRQKKDDYKCTSDACNKISSPESVSQKKDDSECNLPASDKILSAENVKQKLDDSEFTSAESEKILSTEFARQKKDDYECTTSSGHDLRSECIDASKKDGSVSESNISSNTWEVASAGMEVIESDEDNFDMEVIENDEVDFEPVEKSKLEETCVLVEGDDDNELHFVQGIKKHKSYKKTIQDALSSKLRSPTKKQNQFKDCAAKNNAAGVLEMNSDKRKLTAQDSFESDWELL